MRIYIYLSIVFVLCACQKDEEPYVRLKSTGVNVSDMGGETTVAFETNSSWVASSSEDWCTITPSRGELSSNSTTIKLAANNGYETRTCKVSIMAGGVSETLTITQLQKDAIILTNKSYELSSSSHKFEVGVKTNVDVEVIIDDADKEWISTATTRALNDEVVTLHIADNNGSEEARSAEVYIKDRATDLQDVLKIVQRGVWTIPAGVQLIEGDKSRVQHLNVEGDFVFRMSDLDNDDVYFVFSNENEKQSVALPQLVGDVGVVSKIASGFHFSDSSFIVSGKPSVSEFNNNPPKLTRGAVETDQYQQSVSARLASLGVGASEHLYDLDDKPQLSTVRKVVSAHGKNLYVWVADDCWYDGGTKSYTVTQPMVDALADKFLATGNDNDIYEWVTNATGEHWGATPYSNLIGETDDIHIWLMDIDNDDRTTGVVTLGYFYARNNYLKSVIAASNEKLMFTIDAVLFAKPDEGAWSLSHSWPSEMVSTLAHEFTHMVYFYQHRVLRDLESDRAINEMCAQCVEDLVANKILADGPRGVPYAAASAGTNRNSEGRLPIFNSANDYNILDWSESFYEMLTNYSKTYAFGAYLMRNYGGANFIRELIQNDYTGSASIVEAVNANGGMVSNYGDLLQRFGAATLLSDRMDMSAGYRYNRGNQWSQSTVGGITYDLGSINFYNYFPTPFIYDKLPTTQKAGSNLFYSGGNSLSGEREWYFKGVDKSTKVTVVVK